MPSNPVPANATVNLLFVAGDNNGNFAEFTGSGTVANGKVTGTGSCSPNTSICQGQCYVLRKPAVVATVENIVQRATFAPNNEAAPPSGF